MIFLYETGSEGTKIKHQKCSVKLILCQDFQYEELTDVLCCIFHTVLCLCRVLCPSKVQDKQLREFLLSQNIIIIFLYRHNKQIKFSRLLKFNEGDLIKYQIYLTFARAQVSDMGESRWVETHTLNKIEKVNPEDSNDMTQWTNA